MDVDSEYFLIMNELNDALEDCSDKEASILNSWVDKINQDYNDGYITEMSRIAYIKYILIMILENRFEPPFDRLPGKEALHDFFSVGDSEYSSGEIKSEANFIVQTSLVSDYLQSDESEERTIKKRICKTPHHALSSSNVVANEPDVGNNLDMINALICDIDECTFLDEFVKSVSKYTVDNGFKLGQVASYEISNLRSSVKSFFDEKYAIKIEGFKQSQEKLEEHFKKLLRDLNTKSILDNIKTILPTFNYEATKIFPNYLKNLLDREFGTDEQEQKGFAREEGFFEEPTQNKFLHLASLNLIWKQKKKEKLEEGMVEKKFNLTQLQNRLEQLKKYVNDYEKLNKAAKHKTETQIEALKKQFNKNEKIMAWYRDKERGKCKRHPKSIIKVEECENKSYK